MGEMKKFEALQPGNSLVTPELQVADILIRISSKDHEKTVMTRNRHL